MIKFDPAIAIAVLVMSLFLLVSFERALHSWPRVVVAETLT